MIHTVKGFGIVNKAEIDVSLELSCFLDDPMLGFSPGGSRVIQRGDGVGVLGKNLFNYRYKERLETDSAVGKLVEKKRLNNLVYVE